MGFENAPGVRRPASAAPTRSLEASIVGKVAATVSSSARRVRPPLVCPSDEDGNQAAASSAASKRRSERMWRDGIMTGECSGRPCTTHGEGAETRCESPRWPTFSCVFGARQVAVRGVYASPGHTSPKESAIPPETRRGRPEYWLPPPPPPPRPPAPQRSTPRLPP